MNWQARVSTWLRIVFTEAELSDVSERALRAVEEVVELAQACRVDCGSVHRLVDYVYSRPVGEAPREIAGSFVTLYAVAEALRVHVDAELAAEVQRINRPEVIARMLIRLTPKTPEDA